MNYQQEIIAAQKRIQPFIHDTPVLTSRLINELVNAKLYFKCENFQRMGAFKMRGATNAILQLSDVQKAKGVITHSSGNFAQAVALAAKELGVKATIVMPSNAPQVKKDAVKGYGGNIVESEPTPQAREALANQLVQETGATFLHPSNQIETILGQATSAKELLEDYPDLDIIVAPVGGGGLIAGTALSAYFFGKKCKTIGAEPLTVDDAYRSLQSGKIETNATTNTIADGLKTNLGNVNFPIIQQYVKNVIRVEESEIIAAMHLVWERMKIIIEPSSAVAVAAIIKNKKEFQNRKVGIIISGGNVDIGNLPF